MNTLLVPTPTTRETANRSIETVYRLEDLAVPDRWGDVFVPALVIATHHDRDRKRYLTTCTRWLLSPRVHRTRITYGSGDPVEARGVSTPTARYTASAMLAVHQDEVAYRYGPHLETLIAWAAAEIDEVLD